MWYKMRLFVHVIIYQERVFFDVNGKRLDEKCV
jgi:hypothetical protein